MRRVVGRRDGRRCVLDDPRHAAVQPRTTAGQRGYSRPARRRSTSIWLPMLRASRLSPAWSAAWCQRCRRRVSTSPRACARSPSAAGAAGECAVCSSGDRSPHPRCCWSPASCSCVVGRAWRQSIQDSTSGTASPLASDLEENRFPPAAAHRFALEVAAHLQTLPGVTSVSFANLIPLGGDVRRAESQLRDRPDGPRRAGPGGQRRPAVLRDHGHRCAPGPGIPALGPRRRTARRHRQRGFREAGIPRGRGRWPHHPRAIGARGSLARDRRRRRGQQVRLVE